jgi:hypothetical protein
MPRANTLKTLVISILALLGMGGLVVVGSLVLSPAAGRFDRRCFKVVVEEVRRRPIRAGEEVALRLAAPKVPGSLRLVEAEEERVGGRRRWLGRGHVGAT